MIPANGQRVAIAHDDDYLHLWPGHLESSRKGQGPAVGGVHRVKIHIDRHPTGTADARDQSDVILIEFQFLHRAQNAGHDDANPATRAPDVRKSFVAAEVFVRALIVPFHSLFSSPKSEPGPDSVPAAAGVPG